VISRFPEPIYVTRPLLPPLEAVTRRLREVWSAGWLTNVGAQHERLETALRARLGVEELSLFNNGTTALLTAIKALDLKGEVVTTPFTFPATSHVLAWSGITPVFADIDPVRLTISPEAAAAAITPKTSAILAVHVYGVPCDVEGLGETARRHGLRLVYDAAHAFGTTLDGAGVGTWGDVSMFSFHATKLFHTAEGGALAMRDHRMRARVERLKNFGIVDQEHVELAGINGKMNELQAALGLAVLDCVSDEIAKRRAIDALYRELLGAVPGITVLPVLQGVASSYQYFAVRIDEPTFGCSRDGLQIELQKYNVFTRKYFYPLCSDYPCYADLPSAAAGNLPVAQRVVREVLCLPIYGTLPLEAVRAICGIVAGVRECIA
jgi:dTDP-4-amino-4,6-dideoxygalactose transaminase